MPVTVGAPRLLLRRLREVMAERESAQARLDKVVVLIASNMVAEVCSLYLRRRDSSLELFATEGLNPEAVHNTHLKAGEGLVGLIAEHGEPMQFADAQVHPAFSYRPETGEEVYHSFLGVPILRGGQTIGVLTGMIDGMLERGDLQRAGEHREVLEAFRMFAHDRGWRRRLDEALLTGLTAEAAVQRVRNDTRARMLRQIDPYARERLHDIDDLSNRLLRVLAGGVGTAAAGNLPQDTILIARTMGPAELLDYDRQRLRGLVLEEGGSTSHVAIVARALGIAAISQVKGVLEGVEAGDAAIVDAEGGELHVRPTQEVVSAYSDKVRFRARRQAQYAALRSVPAVTLDGERI